VVVIERSGISVSLFVIIFQGAWGPTPTRS
jgi:hypothetical protein